MIDMKKIHFYLHMFGLHMKYGEKIFLFPFVEVLSRATYTQAHTGKQT